MTSVSATAPAAPLARRGTLALPAWGVWIAALVGGSAIGLLLCVAFFLFAVQATGVVALVIGALLTLVPAVDPVYTRAALGTLSSVQVDGLAVAGPAGAWLHTALPNLVVSPDRVQGTLVRLAVEPGGAILGRLMAAWLAGAGVLGVGLMAVWKGRRARRLGLVWLGVGIQLQAVASVAAAPGSPADLDAAGVSFALNAFLPAVGGRRVALSDVLAVLPPPTVAAGIAVLALVVAYAPSVVAALLLGFIRAVRGGRTASAPWAGVPGVAASALALTVVGAVAAATTVAQPTSVRAVASPEVAAVSDGPSVPVATATPRRRALALPVGDAWAREAHERQLRAPSRVEVVGSSYRYTYRVNGQPEVIRGMGLNLRYRERFTPEERAARLNVDFRRLRLLGVNTVLGWDPAEFDDVLFAQAQANGLGVVVPFRLDPRADYTDPSVRAELTGRVRAWVERFRGRPALRMWGLGNEVLHKIVNPAWLGPQDPARARNARAFSAWLVETADLIRSLDPDHPVTYRSAEDAFAPWVAEALRARPAARPWFIWGINAYTDRLSQILEGWPRLGMDVPVWVSEFAPAGLPPAERGATFRKMWGYVRSRPDWVLGGAVYTWTRNGPEEIDRAMGLTDDGIPVDAGLMATLADLFGGTTAGVFPPPAS